MPGRCLIGCRIRMLFDKMPERNVVSFTTMIDGYAKAGDMASAGFLFDQSLERDVCKFSWIFGT